MGIPGQQQKPGRFKTLTNPKIPKIPYTTNKIWKETTIVSWNIRRGLVKREKEIMSLITQNNVNILFLVETDTVSINSEEDYKIIINL